MAGRETELTEQTLLAERQGWGLRSQVQVEDARLVVCEGPHAGESLALDREIVHVGRSEWCDLSLPQDRRVSKHHCELQLGPEGIRIRDLGSRNGILVGGLRVFDAMLKPGLPIEVGDSILELHLGPSQTTIEISFSDEEGSLVGKSGRMRELFSLLRRLGPRDIPVLLSGETGTGKTSIARALHRQSTRRFDPFVVVNCGALSSSLIESELFGYEKGAFTNANQRHHGFFEQANGGTLFLDEIAELPLELQPKLLDVLERKALRRLGGEGEIQVDFRLLTATHQELRKSVSEKRFRQDLYYRVAVMELEVPPLRERLEDLPLLVRSLLQELSPDPAIQASDEVIAALQSHLWPGNVRQLRNVLERSLIFVEGSVLSLSELLEPKDIDGPGLESTSSQGRDSDATLTLQERLDRAEAEAIRRTLESLQWNVAKAAKTLNISKSRLYERIKRYGLR